MGERKRKTTTRKKSATKPKSKAKAKAAESALLSTGTAAAGGVMMTATAVHPGDQDISGWSNSQLVVWIQATLLGGNSVLIFRSAGATYARVS